MWKFSCEISVIFQVKFTVCFQEIFTWRLFKHGIHMKNTIWNSCETCFTGTLILYVTILPMNNCTCTNIIEKIGLQLWIFNPHPLPIHPIYIVKGKCLILNSFQVLLILGWSLLVFLSLMIALANQKRKLSKQRSTRLRKAFHVLTLGVFVSGLIYDASLLFSASWVAMGVMIIVEVRKRE